MGRATWASRPVESAMLEPRLVQRALRYRYSHDPCEMREMLKRLPRGGCGIDIGVHKGAYSWWMCRAVGRTGRVVGVEPQAELAERAAKALGRDPRYSLFRGAVSDHEGTATLTIPDDGPSHGATLRDLSASDGAEQMRTREVPITTLTLLAEREKLPRVDFIKCDAEGHELAIFRGGVGLLERDRPAALIECDRTFGSQDDPVGELREIFEPLGYRGWCIFKDGLVPIEDFEYDVHQREDRAKHDHGHNFLFAHPDRG